MPKCCTYTLFSVFVVLLLLLGQVRVAEAAEPDLLSLTYVTQLPPELPRRVSGIGYDGEKLWVMIYMDRGSFATLDPATSEWKVNHDPERQRVIAEVAGSFASPGGVYFDKNTMWIGGAYGDSFGAIDTNSWTIQKQFKGKQQQDDPASQSYADVAFDGTSLWLVWHWFRYNIPVRETQLLLKIDPETGKVLEKYPAPAGTRNDGVHGLTWDGAKLWYMKDSTLTAIDPSTGAFGAQYKIRDIKRPVGLAWVNNALWIAEFDGKIWRLPFKD
jgi:hypothetical protein